MAQNVTRHRHPVDPTDDDHNTGGPQPSIKLASPLESVRLVQVAEFLPLKEHDALFAAVCASQGAFQPRQIPGEDTGGTFCMSLHANELDHPGATAACQASEVLSTRLRVLLPTLFTTLDVEPFAVSEIPWTLVNGLDGHSGLPHADSTDGRWRISLLYYFHRMPNAFRGGALEIYDAGTGSAEHRSDRVLTRIDHEDNMLIAFPSHTFHGITDVRCDSSDFADGRFVASAFLGPQ